MPVFQFSGNLNPERNKMETFRDDVNNCIKVINDELTNLSNNWISDEGRAEMPKIRSCMEEIQTANNTCVQTVTSELANLDASLRSLGSSGGN